MKRFSIPLLLIALCGCGGTSSQSFTGDNQPAPAAVAAPEPEPAASAGDAAVNGDAMAANAARDAARLEILRNYLAAWNAHEPAQVGSFLTEDSEYFDAAFAGKQVGRQAIVDKAVNVFLRGMPDLRWETRSAPIIGVDGIAFEWTLTGTHTGTWGGVRPTNQNVSLKGMSFLRFSGDRISYQAVVYDSNSLNRQLGL